MKLEFVLKITKQAEKLFLTVSKKLKKVNSKNESERIIIFLNSFFHDNRVQKLKFYIISSESMQNLVFLSYFKYK
jgi:hypothetical protein